MAKARYSGRLRHGLTPSLAITCGNSALQKCTRYYNHASGRFWARDQHEGSSCSPISSDPYIYAWNDPVDRIDPTGRLVLEDVEIRKTPCKTIPGQIALSAIITCGFVKAESGVIV